MDPIIQSFADEIEKISMSQEDKKKWRNRTLGLAGAGATVAAGGVGLRYARKALGRGVAEASDVFVKKMEAGVRRGVQEGFDQGVANLRRTAPDVADDVAARLEPKLDDAVARVTAQFRREFTSAMDTAAERAKTEAPGIGSAVAEGFRGSVEEGVKGSIKKRLPGMPSVPWRK